jgi:polysaccharide biosynthesis/export protein
MMPKFSATISLALAFIFILSSCASTKQKGLFSDLPDNDIISLPPMPQEERVIEVGDYLSILISGKDKEAAAFLNKEGGASGGGTTGEGGYMVDQGGNIEFPIIGKVKAVGLTANQLKESLTSTAAVYLKDPLVDVRFNTFRISVVGVGAGIKTLPMQKNTLLEGLALAGPEMEEFGRISDVRLFRDYKGQRTVYKIDLRKKDVLTNPEIFQLKHNDVLYIQARSSQKYREDARFYASMLSMLIGLVSLGFALSNN